MKSIDSGCTNKISLLPTMKIMQVQDMPSNEYISSVYNTYFDKGEDGKMIRESIIGGLI